MPKGGKLTAYQGGIRVPCFFRWPGHFKAGIDIDKLTAHIDILPTLAEIGGAKITAAANIEGMSLVPLLTSTNSAWPKRALYTHKGRWKTGQVNKFAGAAIRSGDFKLVGEKQLYNIKEDPSESKNIFPSKPEIARELLQKYDKWWDSIQEDIENQCDK